MRPTPRIAFLLWEKILFSNMAYLSDLSYTYTSCTCMFMLIMWKLKSCFQPLLLLFPFNFKHILHNLSFCLLNNLYATSLLHTHTHLLQAIPFNLQQSAYITRIAVSYSLISLKVKLNNRVITFIRACN